MKRIFLGTLIVSVALSAAIGIVVIIIGSFGELEHKILLTTFSITCASILGLACGPAYESGENQWLPAAGIILAVLSGIAWIVLVWMNDAPGELFAKSIMTSTLLAVAAALLSLVSLAKLDARFIWARYTHYASVALLVGLILGLIWFTESFESEVTFRSMGVIAIIGSALTILMPVFHRLSDSEPDLAKLDAEIEGLRSKLAELEERRRGLESPEGE